MCGDATSPSDVERLLGDAQPQLMVTDPPYGVSYDPAWRNDAGASKTNRTGQVLNDDRSDWQEAWALFPGDVAYVWHGALHAATVAQSLEAVGFQVRAQIVWAKDRLAPYDPRLVKAFMAAAAAANTELQTAVFESAASDASLVSYGTGVQRIACIGHVRENSHGYEVIRLSVLDNLLNTLEFFVRHWARD